MQSAASAGDGISYWEVGNEVYGNGTYGANWETDSHCHTSLNGPLVTVGSEPSQTYNCGPAEYAANVASFASAMTPPTPTPRSAPSSRPQGSGRTT